MSGLQSTWHDESAGTADVSSPGGVAPQLRVVTEESERTDQSRALQEFEAALARGDLSRARDSLLAAHGTQRAEQGAD